MITILRPLLAALLLAALAAPARAASFSCDKAETADEKAICAHLSLNDRDVEMATRFEILRAMLPMGGNAKLREDQEAWLSERRACAGDVACLTQSYDGRLKTLRAVFSEFAKQGPL
ncbi:lysozyme inhibitor LprI family protein [Methylobacterium sp. J-068]|uniref:lysozyme inhibitor LprI family protein n=1 Tax=Methylobacterium sp. J-068 TaxID=2836649 RepID=UPI001FBB3D1A|nr:lysozyme inhibitor LprI family protein [Methylobacterium sp. J-068]MCJ2034224.1 lysozyme inhibitor LprI family protein [Methylobacterium sp. J-068]